MARQYVCLQNEEDYISVFEGEKTIINGKDIRIEGVSSGQEVFIILSEGDAIKFANEILELAKQ